MKVFLFLALIGSFSAKAQNKVSPAGHWQCNWTETLNHSSQSHRDRYYSSDAEIRKRIEDGITTKKIYLMLDGTLTVNWKTSGITRNSSGHWSWVFSSNILTLVINGSSRDYHLTFLSENKIVMKALEASSTLIFDEIVLNRI